MPAQLPSNPKHTALLLGGAAFLMLFIMLHHPVAGGGPDRIAAVLAVNKVNSLVHGMLIAMLLVLLYALQRTCDEFRTIGMDPRAGLLAATVATAAFVIAGSINGFITPQLALEFQTLDEEQHALFPLFAELLYHINQYCAFFASLMLGTALLLWSFALAAKQGLTRYLGLLGLVTGAVPIILLGLGLLGLNVAGMTFVLACFCAWFALLAYWLWRSPG